MQRNLFLQRSYYFLLSLETIYTSLFATRSHSTYYNNRNRKKIKVTYINRQLAVNKLKRSTYIIEFTLNIVQSVVNLQSKTRLYYSFSNIAERYESSVTVGVRVRVWG